MIVFFRESDFFEHQNHDDDSETRAFRRVKNLVHRLVNGRVLLCPRKFVVDSLVLVENHLAVVLDFELDFVVLRLEDELYVQPLILLLSHIVLDVVEGGLLEVLHSLLVLLRVAYVQSFFAEIYSLSVCFLRIRRQLVQAIFEVLVHRALVEFFQKCRQHVFHVFGHFMRERV